MRIIISKLTTFLTIVILYNDLNAGQVRVKTRN